MKLAAQLRENPSLQIKPAPTPPPVAKQAEAAPESTPTEAAPEQSEGAETPAAEATEASAPAAEEAQAEIQEAAPAEATQEGDATEDAQDEGGDGPITPVTGKRAHLRLPEDDKVGRLAAAMMKRNRDMSMAEAVAKASAQLGITPKETQTSSTKPEDTAPKMPATVQETDAAKQGKWAEYRKAMAEVRLEDAANIMAEIDALTAHRFGLERSEERQAAADEAKFNKDFSASAAKASELYAFASDANSPGGKRMLEIERQLQENNDPLYYSPDKPLVVAQMVAAELKIAPKAKTQAPAKPAAPAAQPAAKKGVVPAGGSRTTPPPVNQKPEIISRIQAIKPHDIGALKALHQSLGIQT